MCQCILFMVRRGVVNIIIFVVLNVWYVVYFSTVTFFTPFILSVVSHPFASCCPPWTSCR